MTVFCRNIIESAKRQRSQPIMKKKPIATEIIRNVLDVHYKEYSNLRDNLRIASLCSSAFIGFLRYNDLSNIVPKHIKVHNDYIRFFLPQNKTDIYREENYVYISASISKYRPVGVLRRAFLVLIAIVFFLHLFRLLTSYPSNSSYTQKSGKISYILGFGKF